MVGGELGVDTDEIELIKLLPIDIPAPIATPCATLPSKPGLEFTGGVCTLLVLCNGVCLELFLRILEGVDLRPIIYSL